MIKRFFTGKNLLLAGSDILQVFGAFTVVSTITDFFPTLIQLSAFLKQGAVFISVCVFALLVGIIKNRPRNRFEYGLKGKDIKVSMVVGDVFKEEGALIVPINNEFDSYLNGSTIKTSSTLAQVVARFFDKDYKAFGKRLKNELVKKTYQSQRVASGYRIGTTVCIEQGTQRFYVTANSVKTSDNKVEARDADLPEALSGLWSYLADHGAKENLVIPLIGTGNGRMKMNRADAFKEVVRSFIASCAEKSYCDRLTIVIYKNDINKGKIDMEELNRFLSSSCEFTVLPKAEEKAVGTPVGYYVSSEIRGVK